MIRLLFGGIVNKPIFLRQIRLKPDNRLDVCGFTRAIKLHHAVHRTVIGNRQRRHFERFGAGDQFINFTQPVEQAEFGMNVQVNKRVFKRHCILSRIGVFVWLLCERRGGIPGWRCGVRPRASIIPPDSASK